MQTVQSEMLVGCCSAADAAAAATSRAVCRAAVASGPDDSMGKGVK